MKLQQLELKKIEDRLLTVNEQLDDIQYGLIHHNDNTTSAAIVIYTGYGNDVLSYYCSSDVLALISYLDGVKDYLNSFS